MTDLITCINEGIADDKEKKRESPVSSKGAEVETITLTSLQKEYLIKIIKRDQKNRKSAQERYWKMKKQLGENRKREKPAAFNLEQIKEIEEKLKMGGTPAKSV